MKWKACIRFSPSSSQSTTAEPWMESVEANLPSYQKGDYLCSLRAFQTKLNDALTTRLQHDLKSSADDIRLPDDGGLAEYIAEEEDQPDVKRPRVDE